MAAGLILLCLFLGMGHGHHHRHHRLHRPLTCVMVEVNDYACF